LFLDTTARDIKSAEPVYLRAIEAAPADADCLRNFAVFLAEQLKDFARADDYFARAIEVRVTFLYFELLLLHDNFFSAGRRGLTGLADVPLQARPDDNEIAWQYWRFLREKLKQPGRAVDFAERAYEHQAALSMLTRQPVRFRQLRLARALTVVLRVICACIS
jgi:hypothetical protein